MMAQMKRYLRRANNIPMAVLGWNSPTQKHRELDARRFWLNSLLYFSVFWSHIIDKTTILQTTGKIKVVDLLPY